MPEKLLSLILALIILLQAWLVRKHVGTWIFPACIYGVFWFFYTFIPLIAVPTGEIEPIAVAYILTTCLFFSFSSVAFPWRAAYAYKISSNNDVHYNSAFIRYTFFTLGTLSSAGTIANWGIQGFSFHDIAFNLLNTSGEYLAKRYSGELEPNIAAQLSLTLMYPTAILGGLLYGSRNAKDSGALYLIVSLTPSILVMIVEAAKGTLFLVLALFWAGTLLVKLNDENIKARKNVSLMKIFIWGVPLLSAVVFSFLARGIDTDASLLSVLDKLYYYFASYSSGHLYAFSDWFSSAIGVGSKIPYGGIDDSNGFYTFMAVFNLFGTDKVAPHGVYDEYYYIENLLQTNIYTYYRGLIHDFGVMGSVVFTSFLGFFVHLTFFWLLTSRHAPLSASLFAHFIGFSYTSFIVSLLIWNSVYASFFLTAIVFAINDRFRCKSSLLRLIRFKT